MSNFSVLLLSLVLVSLTSNAAEKNSVHSCEKKVCSLSDQLLKLKQRSAASVDKAVYSLDKNSNIKQKK